MDYRTAGSEDETESGPESSRWKTRSGTFGARHVHFSAEEKIRVALEGLRGEEGIAEPLGPLKDALWDRFFMGAPQRQSGCVPRQAFRRRHGV